MKHYSGGLSAHQLYRRIKKGVMTRLAPGIHVWGKPSPVEAAHVLSAQGFLLTGRTLAQLMMEEEVTLPIEVSIPHRQRRSDTPWVRFHRTRIFRPATWGEFNIELPVIAATRLATAAALRFLNHVYAGRKGQAEADKHAKEKLSARAKRLLNQAAIGADSPPERDLVAALRQAGLRLKCNSKIGDYHWDIELLDYGIAIEVDGFRYHRDSEETQANFRRDRWKANDATLRGYTVLRYAAGCIYQQLGQVVDQILAAVRPDPKPGRWSFGLWKWHPYFQGLGPGFL